LKHPVKEQDNNSAKVEIVFGKYRAIHEQSVSLGYQHACIEMQKRFS